MELNDQLRELVSDISPTDSQQRELRDAHIRLRERLMADEDLKPLIVGTFLQGSYRRHTAKRPESGDKPDVDIVVVTRLDRHEYTPEQAMNVLRTFLNCYYAGKWKKKGRSVGIEMGKVKLDVVLTSAPSEALERSLLKALQQENDYGDALDAGDEWRQRAPLDPRPGSQELAAHPSQGANTVDAGKESQHQRPLHPRGEAGQVVVANPTPGAGTPAQLPAGAYRRRLLP